MAARQGATVTSRSQEERELSDLALLERMLNTTTSIADRLRGVDRTIAKEIMDCLTIAKVNVLRLKEEAKTSSG